MKLRFRSILDKTLSLSLKRIAYVIFLACVLYNVIIDYEFILLAEEDLLSDPINQTDFYVNNKESNPIAL